MAKTRKPTAVPNVPPAVPTPVTNEIVERG